MFLSEESQGRGVVAVEGGGGVGLMGCRLWGRTESDMTEATEQQQQQLATPGDWLEGDGEKGSGVM